MDELDLLKKDWNKTSAEYPKVSYNDIYKMILKRSSSIVKWIFIISLLEFAIWTFVAFALKDVKNVKSFDELNADAIIIPLSIVGYAVLGYFFYLFFKNYRTISVTDNAKTLMESILKTRRTVRHYVAFNIIYMVITSFVVLGIQLDQNEAFILGAQNAAANGGVFLYYSKIILVTTVFLTIAVIIMLLLYWLIYGILLKKLNRNYKELKKLEF